MEIRMKEINSSSNSNNNGDIKKDVVEEVVPVEEAEKSQKNKSAKQNTK